MLDKINIMNLLRYKSIILQIIFISLVSITVILTIQKEGMMSNSETESQDGMVLFNHESYGGVEYIGKNIEITKNISDSQDLINREKESKPIIDSLGKELDTYFTKLRSKDTPYRWVKELLLNYKKNKGEVIDIELSKFGENYSDTFATFRVKEEPWLPVEELLECILKRWLWDHNKENKSYREEQGKGIFNEFMKGEVISYLEDEPTPKFDSSYFIDDLLVAQYSSQYISKLKDVALGSDQERRSAALGVLGRGVFIEDPAFFGNFLEDKDENMRKEAMIALFLFPDDNGLNELKKHYESIKDLFEEQYLKFLKKYLNIKK